MKDTQDIENFDRVIGSTDKEAAKHQKLIDKLLADKQLKKEWKADTGDVQQHWYAKGGVITIGNSSHTTQEQRNREAFDLLNEKLISDTNNPLYDDFQSENLFLDDTNGFISIVSNHITYEPNSDKERDFLQYLKTFLSMNGGENSNIYIGDNFYNYHNYLKPDPIKEEYDDDYSFFYNEEDGYAKGGKVDKMREKISSKYEIMMDSAYGAGSKVPVLRPKGGFGDGVIIDDSGYHKKIRLLSSKSGRPIPGKYEFTDIDKAMVAATKYVDKYVDKYAKGGTIRKGDYVEDYGDIGLVNKTSRGVAYVKFDDNSNFQPVQISELKEERNT